LLKIQHYDVDIQRTKVPISGTAIREKPLSNWDYISDAAKSFFVKKVVVMGPESAGKTTMCQRLAQKFRTVWVPEYGRELSEQKPDLELSDFPLIVERQIQSEEKLLSRANKLLFCDTECLTTMIFSRLYFP
jgi:HTH-type transcriptional repressor of NAD biosynthesis genes